MLARALPVLLIATAGLAAEAHLSVQVLNKPGGKPVEGLAAADLSVVQGDSNLEILSMRAEERPLDLVIVVERRRWEPLDVVVQDSLGALASRLRGSDRTGLIVAGPGIKEVVPPGSPPGALARALTLSNVNPGTRLPRPVPDERGPVVYDAILTAVAYAPPDDTRRRAVLAIGSGYDRSSQSSAESVTEAALRQRTIVCAVVLPEETFQTRGGVLGPSPTTTGPPPPDGGRIPPYARLPPPFPTPRPLPRRSDRTLETVVVRTGGEQTDDWKGGHGLSALADRLRRRYELVLKSFDGRLGDAEVRLEGAAARKNKKAVVMVRQPPS